jgi:hypothetical protein
MFNYKESQVKFSIHRSEHISKFRKALEYTKTGAKVIYPYKSKAIREAIEQRAKLKNIPIFHEEYEPDFTQFQYDLELFIFFNWKELYARELELSDSKEAKLLEEAGLEYGCTFMRREEHLANAVRIRWPERILPSGDVMSAYALTPWAKDYLWGLSNYSNIVTFGGGGQGKTYSALAFSVMAYDNFIYTKSGAQCSFSTVSQSKLESSIWSHVNKLYSYTNDYQYSLYGGKAIKAPDYMYRRKDIRGKYIDEGGTMRGILLVKGAKDAKQIDKLTGQHDVKCRIYLLDEAQSTGPAPLSAYTNMYLHPKWGWFLMAGNYDMPNDLLGINSEPNNGWESVDEKTHFWEGSLKSPESELGQTSLVIHYNNDLSPAILDPEMEKRYSRFLPTLKKKKKLYPTEESANTIAAKRFWIGFRYEKEEGDQEKVITSDIIHEFKAHEQPKIKSLFSLASLDTAPSNNDRNILTIIEIGLNDQGYAEWWPSKVYYIKKPTSQLKYYEETSNSIISILNNHRVESGHSIMDWTQRTQLLEGLSNKGHTFHHLIYQQAPPSKIAKNDVTGVTERPIQIDTVPTFAGKFEKNIRVFAHEKFVNRITFAAYLFRLFIEHQRVKNFNSSILQGIDSKPFEKEFCLRVFEKVAVKKTGEDKLRIDSKDAFKGKHAFSPDILDTLFQAAYLIYVLLGIKPSEKGLGNLKHKENKKPVDNRVWDAKLLFRKIDSSPIISSEEAIYRTNRFR